MCKRLVCFRHAMDVFTFLHSTAAISRGIQQFGGQTIDHGGFITRTGVGHNPPERQRLAAFGVEVTGVTRSGRDGTLTPAQVAANRATLDNVRLWDHQPLLETFGQIQEIRTYYDFVQVDNDRYLIDGKMRQVMLSARELNTESLPNQSWVNNRLSFTHGYGLTLGPVNQVTTEGLPVLFAITLHEAGHAYAAKYFGDKTAWMLGRTSLNPVRHIDPIGTVVVPAITAFTGFLFGWAKPVPVNFENLRDPKRDMLWVAAAGPGANVLMALGWVAVAKVLLLFEASGEAVEFTDEVENLRFAAGHFWDGASTLVKLEDIKEIHIKLCQPSQ